MSIIRRAMHRLNKFTLSDHGIIAILVVVFGLMLWAIGGLDG